MKKTIIFLSLFTIFTFSFAHQSSLSVSSNGEYTISVDDEGNAYLWNLDKKTNQQIDGKYNRLSAFFVPNTNYYMLQKDDNKVVVNDINNKKIKEIKLDYPTYGQAISSDLNNYVSANRWFDFYLKDLSKNKTKPIFVSWCYAKEDHTPYSRQNPYKGGLPNGCTGYNGQIANFKFIGDTLIATFTSSFIVYDINKGTWEDVKGNNGATMNAIDPNGQFVYTADSGLSGIKYNLNDGAKSNSALYYPDDNLENISYVQETKDRKKYFYNGLTNFKFIDKDKIIVTFNGKNQPYLWAFTFDTNKLDWSNNTKWKRPVFFSKNYLPLTKDPLKFVTGNYRDNTDPFPIVGGYNTTFDTSVEAHKLVMAQANGNGIMVYNYNPKDESLKLDWVGEPPKAEEKKEEKKGWFW